MIAIALVLLTVGVSSTAPPLLRFRGGGLELVRDYIELCTLYQTKPHPSVLTALRWDLSHLHPSGTPFRDHDLLPLADLLLLPGATHIKSLSFRGCRLKAAGAVQLSRLIAFLPQLEQLDVSGNKLGADAGMHIADALALSRSLRELRLRGCKLRAAGTDALALALAAEPHATAPLELLDLSNNKMGYLSMKSINEINQRRSRPIDVILTGNLVLTEALNIFTHGLGAIAAVVGSVTLMRSVRHAPITLQWACGVYSACLLMCYLSSTTFHGAFQLDPFWRHIFHILDQCAIYLLIAGSYTPFMVALFAEAKPNWAIGTLIYMWSLCLLGVGIEITFHKARAAEPWIKYLSLVLYVLMGWTAGFPPLFKLMMNGIEEQQTRRLLVGGGIAYTLGVPVFMRNRNLDHAVWHVFVLAGSSLQFLALLQVVEQSLRGTI